MACATVHSGGGEPRPVSSYLRNLLERLDEDGALRVPFLPGDHLEERCPLGRNIPGRHDALAADRTNVSHVVVDLAAASAVTRHGRTLASHSGSTAVSSAPSGAGAGSL